MKDLENISQNNGKSRQFIAAIIVNLVCLSYGISVGWPSPTIPQLRSNDPPVGDKPMSEDQISWITSLLPIGGLLTILFCGILSERIGRKNFALLTSLPLIVSWLFIIFAQNYIHLFVARLFVGIAGAMTFFIVPLYVSEISNESIRGLLGSLLLFSLSIGIILAYVAGAVLSYRLFACLSLILPMIFLATFAFMPETPVYLVRQNRHFQAEKSIMFFRGNNQDLVEQELTKLRSQAKTSDRSSSGIKLSDFYKDRATRNGLIISIGLITGQQLSGIFAMINYAETIFKLTSSSISSEVASIITALIQIVGAYTSTMLMDRTGRRRLALISCVGMAISHTLVAIFFTLQNSKYDVSWISWLPVVSLSTYIVTYCMGIGPVPFVIISEVFNLNISSSASTLCYIFYWAITFASIQIFSVAMQLLGVAGCFFMLASFCVVTFVFTYCLLPETKGRERQDIINELAGTGFDSSVSEQSCDSDKCGDGDELKAESVV